MYIHNLNYIKYIMGIIEFDALASTNTYAKENIDKLGHFDIVLAAVQTAGRGRRGRTWLSREGGLYFSVVLKPHKAQPAFTHAMALSVCDTLKAYGAPVYIKWPNDVLARGKKLCGILSEAVFENNFLKGIIIGAGINVAQNEVKTDKPAVTLKKLGIAADGKKLLNDILLLFGQNYNRLSEGGFSAIKAAYKANFPYLGKEISIDTGRGLITGSALDLDGEGRILVKTAGGVEAVSLGDMGF
ncbi:MAG: biotin--[acetyl-CoA-carboxylase] ligase [Elusimicrobiota bacterium]|jgi:BirA family biotin operon repressor/biotin-[acetyl-CoA-carboxylase] ligase|nr:biotin--[acetyl-CoA-carboxylase] ligase [Elusimicrobiota bacterium]